MINSIIGRGGVLFGGVKSACLGCLSQSSQSETKDCIQQQEKTGKKKTFKTDNDQNERRIIPKANSDPLSKVSCLNSVKSAAFENRSELFHFSVSLKDVET